MSAGVMERNEDAVRVRERRVRERQFTLPESQAVYEFDSPALLGDSYGCVLDLFSCRAVHSPVYRFAKRATDVIGAVIGLVVLLPVFLTAALLVWWVDGGPVLFRQKRVGLNGNDFTLLKFRTMVRNAESMQNLLRRKNAHGDSITFKMANDPRVIPWIGPFMRRHSIDELPQLWNVLCGEMSLVGPRPALPCEVARYDAIQMVRLAAKPGLTCFWQISGRGDLNFEQQLELDRRYVAECSWPVDLWLILQTFPALVWPTGAR